MYNNPSSNPPVNRQQEDEEEARRLLLHVLRKHTFTPVNTPVIALAAIAHVSW
jgi:hypothetical protein